MEIKIAIYQKSIMNELVTDCREQIRIRLSFKKKLRIMKRNSHNDTSKNVKSGIMRMSAQSPCQNALQSFERVGCQAILHIGRISFWVRGAKLSQNQIKLNEL